MFKLSRSLIVEACFLLLILGLVLAGYTSLFSADTNVKAATRWGAEPIAFTWSMRERFGAKDKNGLVDYHWKGETQKYDDSYVNPKRWTVAFNRSPGMPPQSVLRLEIDGQPLSETKCRF